MHLGLHNIHISDALSVWRRNLKVYLRLWKTELIAPVIEPVFTFFAFGFGVGALIGSNVSGMSYLSFVGAGVLAFTVLMRTVFEMTYGAYFRMVYQSTYDAILATPVNAESLAAGEIFWAISKGVIDSLFILPLIVIFGSAESFYTILAIIPLILGCLYLGGFALGVTAHIFDIDNFNIFFALFFSTIFLCGAWFPVDILPFWLQIIAYLLPTTAVIDLTRACLSGNFYARHLYELIYLLVVSFLAFEWALRSIRRRMVV
ncbi:MAG: transporter rane protein family [Acidobacteria bacterium]|nr:transporter rane protein family [Acidobacteriota bacterium]